MDWQNITLLLDAYIMIVVVKGTYEKMRAGHGWLSMVEDFFYESAKNDGKYNRRPASQFIGFYRSGLQQITHYAPVKMILENDEFRRYYFSSLIKLNNPIKRGNIPAQFNGGALTIPLELFFKIGTLDEAYEKYSIKDVEEKEETKVIILDPYQERIRKCYDLCLSFIRDFGLSRKFEISTSRSGITVKINGKKILWIGDPNSTGFTIDFAYSSLNFSNVKEENERSCFFFLDNFLQKYFYNYEKELLWQILKPANEKSKPAPKTASLYLRKIFFQEIANKHAIQPLESIILELIKELLKTCKWTIRVESNC